MIAGVQAFWSVKDKGSDEYTRVGVRDGTVMPGIDLWDEVNGDLVAVTAANWSDCQHRCIVQMPKNACKAWTFTSGNETGTCRLKAYAHRSILVTHGSPGCFLPTHGNFEGAFSWSGFIQQKNIRFAQLYVDRSHSWASDPATEFGHFAYAQLLRLRSSDATIDLHTFIDKSIVEVFASGSPAHSSPSQELDVRATVTARVYPRQIDSDRLGLYNLGNDSATVTRFDAWRLGRANASREEVLAGASRLAGQTHQI